MQHSTNENKYKVNLRLIYVAAFTLLGFWFAHEIISVLFLFFFAIVLSLVLNAPTMWLVSKKVPRTGATLLVFLSMLLVFFFVGWLILPRIMEQVTSLASDLPQYFSNLQNQLASWLKDYPSLQKVVSDNFALQDSMPSATKIIANLGRLSYSFIGLIFIFIVFFSLVLYMLINPVPLLETYLLLFNEEKRPKAAQALAKASKMMVGWIWSNLVAGSMEAVAVFFFLSYMDVPGVWIWAGLALFAELVPKLGLYIMAVPAILIALSVSPLTALWVLIFYLVLNEIMGDFVMPRIQASAMNLHPVSTLFVMLAMASAFGLIGALIATPLTAFIKAYYETFYLPTTQKDGLKGQVELVLKRQV
jgi:predicted PurR-regulated permease PerM